VHKSNVPAREALVEARSVVRTPLDHIADLFPPRLQLPIRGARLCRNHPLQGLVRSAWIWVLKCPSYVFLFVYLFPPLYSTRRATTHPGATLIIGIVNGLLALTPDPTTPVTCVGLETRVVRAHVVVFREPRFGKGLALARVDNGFGIGQGCSGYVPRSRDGFTSKTSHGRTKRCV
jgi:hypothetical protein